jgi:flagellar protein FlaH
MSSLSLDITDFILMRKLRIYPIMASKSKLSAEQVFSIVLENMEQFVKPKLAIIDSLTTFITHTSIEETMTFFESSKSLCDKGTSIIAVVNSYAFSEADLGRVRSMCDAHLRLRTEQVGDIMVKVLEVAKVRGAEMSTGNVVSFDVEPMLGMRIIPTRRSTYDGRTGPPRAGGTAIQPRLTGSEDTATLPEKGGLHQWQAGCGSD